MKTKLRRSYEQPRFLTHMERIDAWRRREPFYPIRVDISPAAHCNQRCIFCYSNYLNYPKITIPREVLLRSIREMAQLGVRNAYLQGTGEPLLNTATPEAVVTAKQEGMPTVYLVTNGVLLNERSAEQILAVMGERDLMRISVVENSAERYAVTHGCRESHWNLLMRNLENIARIRARQGRRFTLIASVYPFPHNVGHIYDTVKMLKDLSFDVVIVSAPLLLSVNPEQQWPRDIRNRHQADFERLPELEDESFLCMLNVRWFDILEGSYKMEDFGCQGIDFYTHIAADGGVYPCFKHWLDKEFCYGNLCEQSFADIWNSQTRKEIRARVISEGPDPVSCCHCPQCRINELLWQISHPSRYSDVI